MSDRVPVWVIDERGDVHTWATDDGAMYAAMVTSAGFVMMVVITPDGSDIVGAYRTLDLAKAQAETQQRKGEHPWLHGA